MSRREETFGYTDLFNKRKKPLTVAQMREKVASYYTQPDKEVREIYKSIADQIKAACDQSSGVLADSATKERPRT